GTSAAGRTTLPRFITCPPRGPAGGVRGPPGHPTQESSAAAEGKLVTHMRISVVGTGHVGLTTAACLAHLGHEVLGVDDDTEKISRTERGEVPFHEPGLAELVREGLDTGRLRVSSETHQAARHG